MDFMKVLRSLEEFLYEIMSWLVFYPRTVFRILRHPAAMADYTLGEMGKEEAQRFSEAISPPLALILSLLLGHVAEMVEDPAMQFPPNRIGQIIFDSQQGLLLFRSVCFGTFALIASISIMHRMKHPVNRETLRGPFYVQSYLVAPFAILVSLSGLAARLGGGPVRIVATAVAVASVAWYIGARAIVYRHLTGASRVRSLAIAGFNFVWTSVFLCVATFLLLQLG